MADDEKLNIAAQKIYDAILEATGDTQAIILIDFATPNNEPEHMMLKASNNPIAASDVLFLFKDLIEDKALALQMCSDWQKEEATIQ